MHSQEIGHYKYIHIFYFQDSKSFNPKIVEFINKEFNFNEHLFVTPHKNVYEAIKNYSNVFYYSVKSEGAKARKADIINYFAEKCDWLILHSFCRAIEFYKIKKKYLNKIVWRSWGHDVNVFSYHNNYKDLIKSVIFNPIWKSYILQFKSVGIANTCDLYNFKKLDESFDKRINFMLMPYPTNVSYADICDLRDKHIKKEKVNVMVGHSASAADNHLEILKRLYVYRNENIEIFVMWPYSHKNDYNRLQTIKEYAKVFDGRVTFVENYIDFKKYIQFLDDMDIVIFDGLSSYALGNIGLSISLRKKIFLNSKGVIRQAFDSDDIPYSCTDVIGTISYDEFIRPLRYPKNLNSSLEEHGYEYCVQKWRDLFNWLDNKS